MEDIEQFSLPRYQALSKPHNVAQPHDPMLQGGFDEHTSNEDKGGVGRCGASLNMINTVIGGGISIVATPAAVGYLGLAWFITLETIFCILTGISMFLLIDMADQTQLLSIDELVPTVHSYSHPSQFVSSRRIYDSHILDNSETITKRKWYFKLFSKSISLITAINCFGVIVAFFVTMNDVLTNILGNSITNWQYYGLIVPFLLIIVFIFCLIDEIGNLEYLSLISMVLCFAFLIILIVNCILLSVNGNLADRHTIDFNLNKGVSVIILSWACQFNMLPTYESLRPQNKRRVYSIDTTLIMCLIALIIYLLEGIIAYYSFESIEDNIIDNIDPKKSTSALGVSSTFAKMAMIALSFGNYLTVPLFFIEMRHRALHFVNLSEHLPLYSRAIITLIFILLSILCVWVFESNIGILIDFIGTIGANCLAWLFPGLLYLMNIYRLDSWNNVKIASAVFFNVMFIVVLISGLIVIF